jgi:leader peptidase (prepilin peptidase) / N-methyltransferase
MFVSPAVDAAIAGVFGLLFGSFFNVVVHRLPQILDREWWSDFVGALRFDPGSHERVLGRVPDKNFVAATTKLEADLQALPRLTLAQPRSRCPHCGHAIRWYENIPVVSWLALRGKCSACGKRISVRYPIVEAVTAGFFALCAFRWGLMSPQAFAWAAFAGLLICMFLIDMDTFYIPTSLNYGLLWLGLLVAAFGWTIPAKFSIIGAAAGFLAFWSVARLFKLITGKEGLGEGDFTLLAGLAAWLGAHYLLAIILVSSVVGSVIGIILILVGKMANKDVQMPFGPYLAGAGLVCLAIGPARVPALFPFAFPFGSP